MYKASYTPTSKNADLLNKKIEFISYARQLKDSEKQVINECN